METNVKASKMGIMYQNILSGWRFCSNASHHPGCRIVVAWNPLSFHFTVILVTMHMIHCYVKPVGGKLGFFCLFVYVFKRELLWKDAGLLCDRLMSLGKSWVISK